MNVGSWVARRRSVSMESAHGRHAAGPRFERFAAAMQATPPPIEQVLPDLSEPDEATRRAPGASAGPGPAYVRPDEPLEAAAPPFGLAEASADNYEASSAKSMSDAAAAGPTVVPRRPVADGPKRSRADVPWLGIGSWLLLCGALFASLVGWPDQTILDRVTSLWSGGIPSATIARTPPQDEAAPAQEDPSPVQGVTSPLPAGPQDLSGTRFEPADEQEALPPIELAPPIRSETPAETAGSGNSAPPLPRFKPSVDRVAAKFSNAFFEYGDRLQQQGDFDAAIHMRRQATNLNPWRTAGASDL